MKRYALGFTGIRSIRTFLPIRLSMMRLDRSRTHDPSRTMLCSISDSWISPFTSVPRAHQAAEGAEEIRERAESGQHERDVEPPIRRDRETGSPLRILEFL